MRKIFIKSVLALFGLMMLAGVNVATAQTVNMERWIELTVKKDANIGLVLAGDTDNTAVKIESGSTNDTIIVAASWGEWPSKQFFLAGDITMKIYGNVKNFSCFDNNENITGINVSKNTGLVILDCASNNISSLDLTGLTKLHELYCNNNNFTSLDVSGCTALEVLSCNYANLTSLDVSECTALTSLGCSNNTNLASLDVSGCKALESLWCNNTNLTSLDVSGCKALQELVFENNNLSTLDLSSCVNLERIGGYNNALTTINVKGLEKLYFLSVALNKLTSLDISGCYALTQLSIRGNKFTTPEIEKIYCSLPQREVGEEAYIIVLENESDPNKEIVMATTKRNATDKNWNVCYAGEAKTPIGETSGSYTCPPLETYPLWVAGVQVNENNASNIKGEGITGKVSYNPDTKTLTLNNATITDYRTIGPTNNQNLYNIFSNDNININVIGTNSLKLEKDVYDDQLYGCGIGAYYSGYKDVNLMGNGILNIEPNVNSDYGVYENYGIVGDSILLDGSIVLNIVSPDYGIKSNKAISISKNVSLEITTDVTNNGRALEVPIGQLVIDNSDERIIKQGDDAASATPTPSLTMQDDGTTSRSKPYVKIEPSTSGIVNATTKGIEVRGGKGYINIETNSGVSSTERLVSIYDLSGRLVRTAALTSEGDLLSISIHTGIYIVRIGNSAEKVVVW